MGDFIYKKETYTLETLSPVHIGTGNKLGNVDFYETSNIIHRINIDKLVECLPENVISELVSYIENGRDLKPFVEKCKNNNESNNEIILYSLSLGEKEREEKGKIKIKTLYENVKHPKGLYIPASTIKGAIRTAVLYSLIDEYKYRFDIKNNQIVLKNKNGKVVAYGLNVKNPKSVPNYLNRRFFGGNPSNDIFKYLKVSDSSIEGFKDLEVRIVYVANTTTYYKKPPEYYEVISGGTKFGEVNVSYIEDKNLEKKFLEKYEKTIEKMKDWKYYVCKFSQKLIEAELEFWNNEKVEENIRKAINKSPNRDSLSVILDNFNKKQIINQLEEMKEKNTSEEPVIRIGKLTGYLTHSIGLLLATNPNRPYDVRIFGRILNNRAKNHLFPLTRRLTLDNQTLGWCKLKKNPTKIEKRNNTKQHQEKIEKVDEEAVKKLAEKLGGRFRK